MKILIYFLIVSAFYALPDGFVYLRDIDSTIIQEIRYAGYHNFVGYPIQGYNRHECILTKEAAYGLAKVQQKALKLGYSLKVWDCYRPQKAVDNFVNWSQNDNKQMKEEFYPDLEKEKIFPEGYVATKSNHSRGSTVDLTLVMNPPKEQEEYHVGDQLRSCYSVDRFADNSIDMGTGFDCFSQLSWTNNREISFMERQNRILLLSLMKGFTNYEREWWHFTLKDQPYSQYFDFDIQ